MRTVKLQHNLVGLILAVVLTLTTGASVAHGDDVHATGKSGRVPMPVFGIDKAVQGEKCVEPEAVMRRDHMKFILHQRDKTMHEGIRTTKHSLKNCVDCHADPKTGSVLGQEGFCSACHQYTAVKIDCFTCHSAERETAAAPAPGAVRALGTGAASKTNVSAKGKKP